MRTVRPPDHTAGSEPALTFDQLRATLVELQPTLLAREGFTAVFGPELWLWSWVTEVLVGMPNEESPRRYIDHDGIESGPGFLLRLAIWSALADSRPPLSMGNEGWDETVQKNAEQEPNTRELLTNKTSVLAYLAFPLLEGVTKLRCSDYVDLNGNVRQRFKVGTREYDPAKPTAKRVSSLKDLLWLLHDYMADADEKHALESIRKSIHAATGTDAFEQIYRWRNSQAHGSESLRAIGYTVYNLALLIGLHGIRERYDEIREDAQAFFVEVAEIVRRGTSYWTPWHYYPPHWRDSPPGAGLLLDGLVTASRGYSGMTSPGGASGSVVKVRVLAPQLQELPQGFHEVVANGPLLVPVRVRWPQPTRAVLPAGTNPSSRCA